MSAHTQDLPPKGGYAPINFKRVPAKTLFSGIGLFSIFGASTTLGMYVYAQTHFRIKKESIEKRSGELAILPLLLAERDRALLLQMRKNREEEGKLMANVEGWEVGTYYGEPIYKTLPKDKFVEPNRSECYVHGETKAYSRGAFLKFFV